MIHKRRVLSAALLLPALLCLLPTARAQLATSDEYGLKAAFLYNIARMVEWPEEPAKTFRICFYGEDLFGDSLAGIAGKVVRDHPLEFKRNLQQQVTSENLGRMREALQSCEILFVSQQVPGERWQHIREAAKGLPVLTVGEVEGFAQQGGMIALLRDEERLKIQINRPEAELVSLSISSRLLALAELVETQE